MRISDWSSDVCSSDLFILLDLHFIVDGMALLQRLAAVRGRLSLCADQAAAAKWWLSMPMASVSAEGPMPKALSTRSEEHTSELQSLMRISYAVFCLKKKNKHKKHTYDTLQTNTTIIYKL